MFVKFSILFGNFYLLRKNDKLHLTCWQGYCRLALYTYSFLWQISCKHSIWSCC